MLTQAEVDALSIQERDRLTKEIVDKMGDLSDERTEDEIIASLRDEYHPELVDEVVDEICSLLVPAGASSPPVKPVEPKEDRHLTSTQARMMAKMAAPIGLNDVNPSQAFYDTLQAISNNPDDFPTGRDDAEKARSYATLEELEKEDADLVSRVRKNLKKTR